jgi:hypothetical protein
MKKIIYSITTVLLIGAALNLSSCLKDSKFYVNVSQGVPLVELPLEARNLPGNLVAEALPISSTPQVIQVAVNLASVKTLSSPLTVTLALDTAAITTYNHANGLDTGGNVPYVLLPPADYSIPTYQVTIPAGQHLAYLKISINTSLVNPSGLFILPIKIVNGGGQQISNYNELLLGVGAKNQYDGEYIVTGTLTDNTSTVIAPITGSYPETVYLETSSATTDGFYDPNIGFGHAITTSAGASYYGSFAPVFTFSGSTITGITNYYGQYSGSHVRSAVLDPTGVNKYTTGSPGQAGSVFQVTYIMDQGDPGVTRTTFVETFTYQGPRP